MIIDWYTIIFQIINFLVIVFLLRRFLYGPIIKAMDDREQKIVEREETAVSSKEKAEQEAEEYRRKSDELEEQQEEILDKAAQEAEEEKKELLDRARSEVEETRKRWVEALEREKESFVAELRRRIGAQACSIARRCLEDLADARLEELIWKLFLQKLAKLPAGEAEELQKALQAEDGKAELVSAFKTPDGQIEELKKSLTEALPGLEEEPAVKAKTDQSLVCGIELQAGGYRVAWNIDSYLEDLEDELLRDLEQAKPADPGEEVPGSDE